ncbi:hypothetical protein KJ693_04665 [bacterium]|nr:hypothetical protein [bacterium]MBU1614588.1 hypothetical protein [bacterium]
MLCGLNGQSRVYKYRIKEGAIEVIKIEEGLFTLYHQAPIYTNLILPLKLKEMRKDKTFQILINLPKKPSFISSSMFPNDLVLLRAKSKDKKDKFELSLKVIDEQGKTFAFIGTGEIKEKLERKSGTRINRILLEIRSLQKAASDVEIGFALANLNHADPEELISLLEERLKGMKPIVKVD